MHARGTRAMLMRSHVLREFADEAALHHERRDGSGYPYNLRASQIPLVTAVVTVADLFDAMTHPRPYHEVNLTSVAVDTIAEDRERWWHPGAVDALGDYVGTIGIDGVRAAETAVIAEPENVSIEDVS